MTTGELVLVFIGAWCLLSIPVALLIGWLMTIGECKNE